MIELVNAAENHKDNDLRGVAALPRPGCLHLGHLLLMLDSPPFKLGECSYCAGQRFSDRLASSQDRCERRDRQGTRYRP